MYGIDINTNELTDSRFIIVVGGVHGAGKSTYCRELLKIKPLPYITPEEIKKEIGQPCSKQKVLRILQEKVLQNIKIRKSFCFEHVMSGHYIPKLISMAKKNNFKVHLVYIDIKTVEQALARIDKRLKSNGHDVEREKIEDRLRESRINFYKKYSQIVDSWVLYNNDESTYRRVASFNDSSNIVVYLETEYKCFESEMTKYSVSRLDERQPPLIPSLIKEGT